jgi:hypothetical protein
MKIEVGMRVKPNPKAESPTDGTGKVISIGHARTITVEWDGISGNPSQINTFPLTNYERGHYIFYWDRNGVQEMISVL